MERKNKAIAMILLLYITGTVTFCTQKGTDRIRTIANDLLYKQTDKDARELYKELIKCKKQSIPYLIEKIDAREYGYVGKLDPLNSNVMSLYNYDGMQAAYAVELILSGANYNGQQVIGRKTIALFYRNIILKRANRDALEYNDMITVKAFYNNWWQHHHDKDIKDLIIDWNRGDKPLSHSAYEWY
ncbi:MAG: hypothetical protein V4577_29065 [Bacteroidota bacterium]